MKVLLDTNVVSEWVKPEPDANVIEWFATLDEEVTFLSVVTLGEIRSGIERIDRGRCRTQLEVWLRHDLTDRFDGRVLSIDQTIALEWGALTRHARRSGIAIGTVNTLLAATARIHGLAIATRNSRHFTGLSLHLINLWGIPT